MRLSTDFAFAGQVIFGCPIQHSRPVDLPIGRECVVACDGIRIPSGFKSSLTLDAPLAWYPGTFWWNSSFTT
jgi:hypothetical protein